MICNDGYVGISIKFRSLQYRGRYLYEKMNIKGFTLNTVISVRGGHWLLSDFFQNRIFDRICIDFSCGIYFLFLAPIVKNMTETTIYGWGSAEGAGILSVAIILLNVLEIFAVAPFLNFTLKSLDKVQRYNKIVPLILLLILHAAIAVLSIIFAFQLIGYDFKTSPIILAIAVTFIIAKEFYLVKNVFAERPNTPLGPTASKVVIALYSCLIFTIFWEATKTTEPNNTGMFILELIPMALFFAFFYYPLRLPFTFNSIVTGSDPYERLIGFVSFLLVFIPAALRKF